jgi:hypothetical protein
MQTYEQQSTITVPGTNRTPNDPFDELDEIEFGEGEQAEKPILEIPRLWWFNGLPTDADDTSAVGWHLKAGIDPILDKTMKNMGIQRYLVQHKRPDKDGSTAPKPYWRLRTCNLVIVAQRLQSALEMKRTDERQGIAYAWGTVYDDHGKPEVHKSGKNMGKEKRGTVLHLRAFVHEMYEHGYYNWLPFTMFGFGTDEVLKALAEQYRFLEYYSELRRARGKNPVAPFYLFSLRLGPGKPKLVGEPPDQGTIYPIVAEVPERVDRAYLEQHLIPKPLIEQIRDGLLTETVLWSIDESMKIKNGRGEQQLAIAGGTSQSRDDQTSSPATSNVPQNGDDPFVQQPQLTWILGVYCGNDEGKARDICGYFGVPSTDQLRMSHFRYLVAQVQSAKSAQNGNH